MGTHIPPDGEHIVIDVLMFPATALMLIATVTRALRRLRTSHGA